MRADAARADEQYVQTDRNHLSAAGRYLRRCRCCHRAEVSRDLRLGLSGAVGALVVAVYMVGGGRSYDYDSGVTVGNFVKTSSAWESLTRQIEFNNHPLFSVLEHAVYELGGTTEAWLRLLPAVAAGAAVALVCWAASSAGLAPAIGGSVVLATNPLFAEMSRQVRGYSVLCLLATASSLLLWTRREGHLVAYTAAISAGMATHLYFLGVLVLHAAYLVGANQLRRTVVAAWFSAVAVGSVAYLPTLSSLRSHSRDRLFQPAFPLDVLRDMLSHEWISVATTGALVLIGLLAWYRREQRASIAVTSALAVLVVGSWIVAPRFLFTRFFVWATPAVAGLVAVAIRQNRRLVLVAAVSALSAATPLAAVWTRPLLPTGEAARAVSGVAPDRVCGWEGWAEPLAGYDVRPRPIHNTDELRLCDMVVVMPQSKVGPPSDGFARWVFSDAAAPIVVLVRP